MKLWICYRANRKSFGYIHIHDAPLRFFRFYLALISQILFEFRVLGVNSPYRLHDYAIATGQ